MFFLLTDSCIILLSQNESESQLRSRLFEKLAERLHPHYWLFNAEKTILKQIRDPQNLGDLNNPAAAEKRRDKVLKSLRHWNNDYSNQLLEMFEKIFTVTQNFHHDTVIRHLPSKQQAIAKSTNTVINLQCLHL